MLMEIEEEVEIYKYIAKDLEFKSEVNDNFLNGLRSGMSELYTYFKSQLQKIGSCQNFKVSVMYD